MINMHAFANFCLIPNMTYFKNKTLLGKHKNPRERVKLSTVAFLRNSLRYSIFLSNNYWWACLVKQQSVDYRLSLPTKDNKHPFSLSVCNKQTEVSHFRFPFAANKRKLPFPISSVFRSYIYIYIYRKRDYILIYAEVSNGKWKTEAR